MLREFVTQAAGGQTSLAIGVMLAVIAAFAVALLWAYGGARREKFEEAARLPLEEDAHE